MATGLNIHERTSPDSIFASSVTCEPFPLPNSGEEAELAYKNKVSLQDVLSLDDHEYLSQNADGLFSANQSFPESSLIWGDNLFALKALLSDWRGKFRLIYLDPPYGTGMDFHARDLKHAYRDKLSAAAYVEFIRRRLLLMRELLSSDGSIYVHIGHQMLFHLKVVMDEIFGVKNFRNLIVRKKCSSKNYTTRQYPNIHDYILFYTKTANSFWNQPKIDPDPDWINREYPKTDARGRYKLVPIHAPGVRNGESGQPWRGMTPPPGKHWQLLPSKLEILDAAGEIHWSKNGNPRRKVYWNDDKLPAMTDYWSDFRDAHHQSIPITGYPTEKNLRLLETIVGASTNPGDYVLDPFLGSGTTAHAAQNLGRKWIGIDDSLQAIATCVKRFRHGLQPMGDYVNNGKSRSQKELPLELAKCNSKAIPFKLIVDSEVFNEFEEELRTAVQ